MFSAAAPHGRLAVLFLIAFASLAQTGWPEYGGDAEGSRYSPLTQINRRNVASLRVAWSFETGDAFPDSEMECQPIVVNGVLYATTPKLRVIALNAGTGALLWQFDPNEPKAVIGKSRNRGVTYWESGAASGNQSGADRRIFVVAREFLYALDARTGIPIPEFGSRGRVDLRQGLDRPPQTLFVSATSPGIVYRDLLILGSLVNETLPSAPGDIRAYDVRSGKIRWSFHTVPHPGEAGYETWPKDAWTYIGGANNWAGMSLDRHRGLVFVPTGSAAFDFYGANRLGQNLYANTLLALDAATGRRVWHFQAVRHDLWDRDFPAPPNLVTVKRGGRSVDAVAQITKSGYVFVFDRDTGKPLFPLEMRAVPPSDVDGEIAEEAQPFPLAPPPFARQVFHEDLVTNRNPAAHESVLARLRKLRSDGQFVPPSLQGTVIFPGFDGGGEWGGAAFDRATGLLYVNSNEMPWIARLVPRADSRSAVTAAGLYVDRCAGCHRADQRGNPPEFPSLLGIGGRRSRSEIEKIIREGNGRMPAFRDLSAETISSLARYLSVGENKEIHSAPESKDLSRPDPRIEQKYRFDGYTKFLDPDGYPAVKPPWGTLNAIDLNRGTIAWAVPFGTYPELIAQFGVTGSENYGGPVVTAGGLLFIGGSTHDSKFHAFDKSTGRLLWQTVLPAGGNATPAVYAVNGREFVAIAAGGGKSGAPSGGRYVAFALP